MTTSGADVATSDVLIVGCGPTGVVLAHLLGGLGVRVSVIERDAEVAEIPRATHLDEETLRGFQATGLAPELFAHTTPFGRAEVVDASGRLLLAHEVGDGCGEHGYEGARFFDQPAFERILRARLSRHPTVRLHLGAALESLVDRRTHVAVSVRGADGVRREHRAAWVVGCDGARSATRGLVGIEMDTVAPPRRWVLVDAHLENPADAARLPAHFRYTLAPERLSLYAHGIGDRRRWEFELGDDDPDDATVLRWVAACIDPVRVRVLRVTRYVRRSLLARSWRAGRVLLAGDAAHLMPPSAGQGLCSGVRDALNLAWKLHLVTSGRAPEALLDSYPRERAPHVARTLRSSLFLARRLEADTAPQRLMRGTSLRVLGALGPMRELLRPLTAPPRRLVSGCFDAGSPLGGRHLPQVPVRVRGGRDAVMLDDVLGYRPALLTRGERADEAAEWAQARGVAAHRVGREIVDDDGRLSAWMDRHRCDFALVRPDRVVFGAGRARDLARVGRAHDAWLGGRADAAPPEDARARAR